MRLPSWQLRSRPGKILLDTWDAAYLGDGKAGYVHTIAQEIDQDGKKLIRTTVEMRLTVKRFSDTIQMSMDTGTIETPDGKVTGVFMKQFLGKQQQLQIDGDVVGKQVQLTLNGKRPSNRPRGTPRCSASTSSKPFPRIATQGRRKFTYLSFEPSINLVLKTEVAAKGYREVVLKGSRDEEKLLLVETIPEKVEYKRGGQDEKMQLPVVQAWLDDKLDPIKSEVEVPGLGPITMYRTTKEQALARPDRPAYRYRYRAARAAEEPHPAAPRDDRCVYRITVRKDDNVATTFSRDDRQKVKNVQGNTFELHVRTARIRKASWKRNQLPSFCRVPILSTLRDAESSSWHVRRSETETDPWKKALRIERWVTTT